MVENPGSVCDDLRELAEVHHAPRGNIAAVYFAITRKYGYTRLESELAHSINVYCRAVPRRIARPLFCNTPCTIDVCPPISWDFSRHARTHTHIHTHTRTRISVKQQRRIAEAPQFGTIERTISPPWLEAPRCLGHDGETTSDLRIEIRDAYTTYRIA